jgi:hypothetical protein
LPFLRAGYGLCRRLQIGRLPGLGLGALFAQGEPVGVGLVCRIGRAGLGDFLSLGADGVPAVGLRASRWRWRI